LTDARIAKLIRMLGASPGEAQNALVILRDLGTDFNAIADKAEDEDQGKYSAEEMKEIYAQGLADGERRAQASPEVNMRVIGVNSIDWLDLAQKVMEQHENWRYRLNEEDPYNELKFINDMIAKLEFGMKLTEKQQNWLARICTKARIKAYG
jgi:hypothetical protein